MPNRLLRCSKTDWRALRKPKKDSRKGDNGRLLICAGSGQYHGSLILSINAALRFCDLVYVYSPRNTALVRKLKESTPNIIVLDSSRALARFMPRIDAILAGPGWEEGKNAALLSRLLRTGKPIVLDAGALAIIARHKPLLKLLHAKCMLTPHRGEFGRLFGVQASAEMVKSAATKTDLTILSKGPTDFISDGKRLASNTVHDVGMTKGGSGDALAGLAAAILADHNGMFESACAAAFLIGLCGARLSKKMGAHYSSADLVEELPFAARAIEG